MSMTKELWEEIEITPQDFSDLAHEIELSVMEIRELMEKEEQEKTITPQELSDLAEWVYPVSIFVMPSGRKLKKSLTQTQKREGGFSLSPLNPLGANPKSFESDYWELM